MDKRPIQFTTKAEEALGRIGKWGFPIRGLHPAHRRFFLRHCLIETHSPGRIRTTAKADAMLATRTPKGESEG